MANTYHRKKVTYFSMNAVDGSLRRDQLDALISSEQSYVVPHVPCMANNAKQRRASLESWRRKICQWAFRVIDHFRLDREVVTIGMNIFDRFLSYHEPPKEQWAYLCSDCRCPCCKRNADPTIYQLAAMTSIFIAAKLASVQNNPDDCGSQTAHFRLTTFADLSRGQFNMDDIYNMERAIYQTVDWKVMVPSPTTFVPYLLTLIPHHEDNEFASTANYDLILHVLQELSRYLTEIATCLGNSCSYQRPSHVAFAAILVSMDLLTYQALSPNIRIAFRQKAYQVCGVTSVAALISQLEGALWPEMLLNNSHESAGAGHPITVARNHGLLDLSRIYYANRHSVDTSSVIRPSPETAKTDSAELITYHPGTSPVSVVR